MTGERPSVRYSATADPDVRVIDPADSPAVQRTARADFVRRARAARHPVADDTSLLDRWWPATAMPKEQA